MNWIWDLMEQATYKKHFLELPMALKAMLRFVRVLLSIAEHCWAEDHWLKVILKEMGKCYGMGDR